MVEVNFWGISQMLYGFNYVLFLEISHLVLINVLKLEVPCWVQPKD